LIEPLGIFFAAMPNKHSPQERVGKEKLEAASARTTTPKLVAAMIASGGVDARLVPKRVIK
jgi:hypothetical protein